MQYMCRQNTEKCVKCDWLARGGLIDQERLKSRLFYQLLGLFLVSSPVRKHEMEILWPAACSEEGLINLTQRVTVTHCVRQQSADHFKYSSWWVEDGRRNWKSAVKCPFPFSVLSCQCGEKWWRRRAKKTNKNCGYDVCHDTKLHISLHFWAAGRRVGWRLEAMQIGEDGEWYVTDKSAIYSSLQLLCHCHCSVTALTRSAFLPFLIQNAAKFLDEVKPNRPAGAGKECHRSMTTLAAS